MATAPAFAEDRAALASGFEPETILPSQLLDTRHLGATLQPETRLMLAVLADAIATLHRGVGAASRAARREFEEVRTWLASDDTRWPYAFLNICHVLGFEPGWLRVGLDRWLAAASRAGESGKVVPMRYAFRRISGSRTRAVVPRRLRNT
jgi:hypothetical protein